VATTTHRSAWLKYQCYFEPGTDQWNHCCSVFYLNTASVLGSKANTAMFNGNAYPANPTPGLAAQELNTGNYLSGSSLVTATERLPGRFPTSPAALLSLLSSTSASSAWSPKT